MQIIKGVKINVLLRVLNVSYFLFLVAQSLYSVSQKGAYLFAVMTNKLLRNWHMCSKYVDDTTPFEIIPRNSISILDLVVRDIHDYCVEYKMKQKKKKMQRNVHKFYEEFGCCIATYMCWIERV